MLPLQPYNNEKITSLWSTFYHKENVFNDQMINELEHLVNTNYQFEKGRTGSYETGFDDTKSNNRNIAYLYPNQNTKWIYDLLFPIVLEANNKYFKFDIDTVTDPIHYVIYPEGGGHLDWHMDVGPYDVNRRKLAMTVQLSDSSEYTGGEFEIWAGQKNRFIELPRQKGDVIIFPTFLLHRVKPVIRGNRKVLVFWTGGRPFR